MQHSTCLSNIGFDLPEEIVHVRESGHGSQVCDGMDEQRRNGDRFRVIEKVDFAGAGIVEHRSRSHVHHGLMPSTIEEGPGGIDTVLHPFRHIIGMKIDRGDIHALAPSLSAHRAPAENEVLLHAHSIPMFPLAFREIPPIYFSIPCRWMVFQSKGNR